MWELPEGWETVRLGSVVQIKSGFACAKRNLVPADEGIAHLRPFNVDTKGQVDLSEVYYIPRDYKDNAEDYALEPGHVLFNNTNSVELVGKTALVMDPMECVFSNHIYRLAVKPKAEPKLEPAWLALALRRLRAGGFFEERCNRWIGQAGFNSTKLKAVEMPLPPLGEQRRIVARVEALFDRIAEARRLRSVASEDAERLMDAVTVNVFPDPEGPLPAGWQVSKIADISQKPQYGYTESAHEEPVGPRFLRITDIQEGEVNWETVPFCPCTEQELEKYRLKRGDIVFARSGATTGKTFLIVDCPEAIFASYLIRLQIRKGALAEYVYAFSQSLYYWRQIQPRGAAQPNVNATILSELVVPIPLAIEDQRDIVRYLESIQAEERALRRAREVAGAELDRLEGSILARAFRGAL